MKKLSAILALLLCMTMLLSVPVAAAETYSFGKGETFKQDDWGKDGFTFHFLQEHNLKGVYDVTKFQDCVWGNSSAYALYVSGRKLWCPSVRQAQTGKFKDDVMWWIISNENGSLMPSNGLTAILKWTAPKDGKYTVNVSLLAGFSQAFEDHQEEYGAFDPNEDMDGVTCSIYHDSKKLYSQDSGRVFYTESKMNVPKLDLDIKQGEALYFIADQNEMSDYDDSRWTIDITRTGDLPTAAPATTTTTTTTTKNSNKTDASTTAPSAPSTTSGTAADSSTTTGASDSSSTTSTAGSTSATVAANNTTAPADTSDPTDGDDSGPAVWPIILVIVVVLAAAGAAVFFVLKKKKSA